MKEKGFTLIELLAVIVILAIIALIAVPIIINIVNDSRESSYKRSIELYGTAVQNAIAKAQLNNNPIPSGELSNVEGFLETVQYEGTEVTCETNMLYADGKIYLAGCSVGTHEVEYTYGTKEILVTPATASTVTTGNVPTGEYNPGDEYIIHIGGEDRIFFVLGTSGNNVDLIMNKNLGSTVLWSSDGHNHKNESEDQQAVTAKEYLASQTYNWETKPHLPTIEQMTAVGCTASYNSCPTWLYDYLHGTTHSVVYIYGYWTVSSYNYNSDCALLVYFLGYKSYAKVSQANTNIGVRPVITIPKSMLN